MYTCFVFIQSLQQDEFLSLRLNAQGEVDQALQKRSPEEIKDIQGKTTRTVMVLPTEWCGIYAVELPQLSQRKIREALPFALEEQLAQPLQELHFCLDKALYHENRYLVVVLNKKMMQDCMDRLRQLHMAYDAITLAWFALDPNEGCVLEHSLMVNAPQFQGVLSADIWTQVAQDQLSLCQWHIFSEGTILNNSPASLAHPDSGTDHLLRLWKKHFIRLRNLLIDDF